MGMGAGGIKLFCRIGEGHLSTTGERGTEFSKTLPMAWMGAIHLRKYLLLESD